MNFGLDMRKRLIRYDSDLLNFFFLCNHEECLEVFSKCLRWESNNIMFNVTISFYGI